MSYTELKTINGNSIKGTGNLVVGGGSFSGTMDDIPDGTTYVKTENNLTDAEKTILSNTSGTNTGDQDLSSYLTSATAAATYQPIGTYATGTGTANGTNTGDQTSIVGISGTKANFDSACSDGNFLFVGDVTQYTDELAQDAVGGMVANSTFVNLAYVDGTPSLTPSLSATGTPSASTFLRGDNTWATPTATVSLTSAEGAASGDVTMASTNTWYTGASVALTAGTWLITAHITLNRTTTTAQQYQVRIHDTTNTVSYASSQQYQASVANAPVSMSLTSIVTLGGNATLAIQAASSTSTNNLIKAATLANGVGNNATKITAIKIA
jgi:hypothetical protein